MRRGRKIALIAGGSVASLVLVVIVAGIVIVQTDWFRNYVRTQIISSVEEATGGTVEIASFSFDWGHLRAQVRNLVVHGLEPGGSAPLLQAKLVEVELKLLSPFNGFVDIASLLVDTPQASVMVFRDGRTNIPEPKVPKKRSEKSPLETIVNLAVGRFDLQNATVSFADQKSTFSARGENLRALLTYNPLNPRYTGEVDLSPLFLKSGNNQSVNVNVKLPVTIEKDRLAIANAQFTTPASAVVFSGSIENLRAPHYAAHLNARVALEEARRAAGLTMPLDTRRGPGTLNADITASMDGNRVQIQSARASLGASNFEASGTSEQVQFQSTLVVAELGRLFRVSAQPQGTVRIAGNAALPAGSNYSVRANLDARNLSMRNGSTRITGVTVASAITADPHRIDLAGLRIGTGYGGFAGSASLIEMAQYQVTGRLTGVGIGQFVNGYDGAVSGPVEAAGNLKNTSDLRARVDLAIAPGRRGIPVSGRLQADYNGRGDIVTLAQSYVALPNSRVDLSGAMGRQIRVQMVSRNMADFRPVANIPVTFQRGGSVMVNATVNGKLTAPQIAAHAGANNFAVEGRAFSSLAADVNASQSAVSLANGTLSRGPMQAQFSASAGLRDWKPEPSGALLVNAAVRNADVADMLALAGQTGIPATGALTADTHVEGTIGAPRGNVALTVMKGTVQGEPFDQLLLRGDMTQGTINLSTLQWTAGPSRLDANATYQYTPNEIKRGQLRAHIASNNVQLAQFQSLVKEHPGLRGVVTLNGDAAANIAPKGNSTDIQLVNLNATLAGRGLQMEGRNLGDLTATANGTGNTVQYNLASNFAGSTVRVNGQSVLTGDYPTTADANIANLPIDQVLAVAGENSLQAAGTLTATARFSGSFPTQGPQITTLNANLAARSVRVNGSPMGDLTASAETRGRTVALSLESNLARSNIRGNGDVQLTADYPVNARVTFANVTYSGLAPLLGKMPPAGTDASLEGEVSVSGPAKRVDGLRATLQLTKLEAHAASPARGSSGFELHNAAPVVVSLDRSTVTVQSARFTGTQTNLAISGTATLADPKPLNLRANGSVQLEALRSFNADIISTGAIELNAVATGPMTKPALNGSLQLRNASFNMLGLPAGISNANGSIAFQGTEATIQNITGETGGGKITLAGFLAYGGPEMQFRLQATASEVRITYPESITTAADAQIVVAGSTSRSLASGTVTIRDLVMHSNTDTGSFLSQAAAPPTTPSTSTGIAAGMRFDIRIRTAQGFQVRTSLTQNVMADADLSLRGTVDHPGMLGRVTVTQGDLVFFGSKYTIDQGSVSFFNPNKINPVLNVDLATTTQGVDVTLNVSGPVDRMKLTYRSDPPLSFQDIVSLLASGKPPSSDPVLAARAPAAPQQNLQQMGASALLGQAVANPVSGRLQRLFGVSQLKIDPQIIGASNTAQATLTLQQQVTRDITFTYIQNVAEANPQILRVEWAIDPRLSAVAQRDINGAFNVDVFYKKRFR